MGPQPACEGQPGALLGCGKRPSSWCAQPGDRAGLSTSLLAGLSALTQSSSMKSEDRWTSCQQHLQVTPWPLGDMLTSLQVGLGGTWGMCNPLQSHPESSHPECPLSCAPEPGLGTWACGSSGQTLWLVEWHICLASAQPCGERTPLRQSCPGLSLQGLTPHTASSCCPWRAGPQAPGPLKRSPDL